jgi:hypothetical protein
VRGDTVLQISVEPQSSLPVHSSLGVWHAKWVGDCGQPIPGSRGATHAKPGAQSASVVHSAETHRPASIGMVPTADVYASQTQTLSVGHDASSVHG